jgi:hypothetical protein
MVARRAFVLITALMVGVILLLLGMGFVGSQADRYRGVQRSAESAQARSLAVAGLEDARLKIQNDVLFPPPMAAGQTTFSYGERLDVGSPPIAGSYSVLIETAYNVDPYYVLSITSIGSLGDPNQPTAQYRITAEMDMRPGPRYCHYHHWEDETAP